MACSAFAQSAATASDASFSIAVVPSESGREGGYITMASTKSRPFYVVLTNLSKRSQSVWNWWNSWGYYAITLELTTADQKKYIISKRPTGFTKNTPTTFLVPSSEQQVYVIRLNQEWQAQPALPKKAAMHVRVKAVYEVSPTAESAKYGVWTGRVESKVYDFSLLQW
jgi:hypothetical protein